MVIERIKDALRDWLGVHNLHDRVTRLDRLAEGADSDIARLLEHAELPDRRIRASRISAAKIEAGSIATIKYDKQGAVTDMSNVVTMADAWGVKRATPERSLLVRPREGGTYRTRDGRKVGPLEMRGDQFYNPCGPGWTWNDDGTYAIDGGKSPLDLVGEYMTHHAADEGWPEDNDQAADMVNKSNKAYAVFTTKSDVPEDINIAWADITAGRWPEPAHEMDDPQRFLRGPAQGELFPNERAGKWPQGCTFTHGPEYPDTELAGRVRAVADGLDALRKLKLNQELRAYDKGFNDALAHASGEIRDALKDG